MHTKKENICIGNSEQLHKLVEIESGERDGDEMKYYA